MFKYYGTTIISEANQMSKIKTAAYISCASNPVSATQRQDLAAKLGVKFFETQDFSELFQKISGPDQHVDMVVVDVEKFYQDPRSSVFDLVRTLLTLIRCSGGIGTKLVASLDLDTDPARVKELLSTESLTGFYPRGVDFSIDEKRQALDDIAAGRNHIPSRFRKLLSQRKRSHVIRHQGYEGIVLTPRQQQVLNLVTRQGASNKVIARTLAISESTVKLHMTQILKKYGARNRTQLAVFASAKNNK
jgi:DNA-binding NarL/FixJ family response regulator